jgi:hypothetical protein
MTHLNFPVVDIAPFVAGTGEGGRVVDEVRTALTEVGFMYVEGHGISLGDIPAGTGIFPVFLCPAWRRQEPIRIPPRRPRGQFRLPWPRGRAARHLERSRSQGEL